MARSPVGEGAGRGARSSPTLPANGAPANGPVRVLVADDDAGVRRAIARIISSKASLELVGLAADSEEAVDLGSRTQPDVALVDVNMPKGGGIRAARELHECSPATKVLALSGSADRKGVLEMLSSGAVGYLIKGASADIVQGILAASRGKGAISNEVAAEVIGELSGHLTRRREEEESRHIRLNRIQQIIDDGAITILFQPIFDLHTETTAGVEALARFPDGPFATPDLCFAEAWKLGLGVELELMAVSIALETARSRHSDLFVAVNASPGVAMTSRFSELLGAQTGAEELVVELTEHEVVEDYDALTNSLGPVRAQGVRVSVDDAGAGYASLRHILRIKPDFIKLDVSLIAGIDEDRAKLALATGITSFAREMGMGVVAEGIETSSQLECVASLGVDYAQGYHLGRPGHLREASVFYETERTKNCRR